MYSQGVNRLNGVIKSVRFLEGETEEDLGVE